MTFLTMSELDLNNKRVIIREDLNVPIENSIITSDARIQAALPTIEQALAKNAAVILLSHLGRPTEGEYDANCSLQPVADYLSDALGKPVPLLYNWLDGIEIQAGEVVLCENVRFNVGEKANDDALAKRMAKLADIFVMDAFATAHRAQCSTHGIAKYIDTACAGPLLTAEIHALKQALEAPAHPVLAIIGGAKVSSKLGVLHRLIEQVDILIVGGGMANTLLAAQGYPVGKSLYEPDLVKESQALLKLARQQHTLMPLPTDVVTANCITKDADAHIRSISEVTDNDIILDIGPDSTHMYQELVQTAKTILWNGPVGMFEIDQFGGGTKQLALSVAQSNAFSIAGGGDTLAAIDKYGIMDKINYISTGGGAFLEYVEGKELPAIAILEARYKESSE